MERSFDSLETRLEDATVAARREGRLDFALALAMMREVLTRDHRVAPRQSYWPVERPASALRSLRDRQ